MLRIRLFSFLTAAIAACIIAGAAVAGCSVIPATNTKSGTSVQPATAQTTAAATETGSRPDAASGTLRIWWSRRESLSPLLDTTATGRAVNRLIYQSLYRIDEQQRCVPELAESLATMAGGTQVIIRVRPDIYFSDGTVLNAVDVAACICFIKEHDGQTQYGRGLDKIVEAEVVDENYLRLVLSQSVPWLPYDLTFPVVPSEWLEADLFDLVPGSGDFIAERFSSEEGLILKKAAPPETPNELTTIRVIEYNSLADAMRGFENDELDLVLMGFSDFVRYQPRGSLRFGAFPSSRILIAACNTASGKTLADPERLLMIKSLLRPDNLADLSRKALGGELSDLPIPALSWPLGGESAPASGILGRTEPAWDAKTRELLLLVPQGEELYRTVARAIGRRLDDAGVQWRMSSLSSEEYRAALKDGHYDLALLETGSPPGPNPSWLYQDDHPGADELLKDLPNIGLEDYLVWREKLFGLTAEASVHDLLSGGGDWNSRLFAQTLSETAARSPLGVLLIRSEALLYGSRIIGQCRSCADHPYQGIEELWAWSG